MFTLDQTETTKGKMQKSGHKRSLPSRKNLREVEGKKQKQRFSCQRCEQLEYEHKERVTEMESFYKEKLNEARSTLSEKDKELKSFKDRLASEVALSVKTGDFESMNNPVSKCRLTEMYQKLKLLQWPKVKDHLKSNDITPKVTRALIQKIFKDATEEMERKKMQIEEVFGLIESSSGLTPQKVKQYKQLAIQNLQMSLYLCKDKKDLLRSPLLEHEAQYSQDVIVKLRLLASECYWLGCLMALNNPPLQPDWQNQVPGMDTWDTFPRDLRTSSVM